MEYRSRLKARTQKLLFKKTILSLSILVVIIILIAFFGLELLVRFSLLLGNIKSIGEIQVSKQEGLILPPTLNPLPEATNSATIEISGIAAPGQTIEVFLNGEYKTRALVDNDSQFKISQLRLETGENRIKAKAKADGKESAFTEETAVIFETTPPALEVQEPFDGQVIRKTPQIKVIGRTEPDAIVSINEFIPVVDSAGDFSFTFPLKEGENVIKVVARDRAGNQTTNEIKVNFEP